MVTHRIPHTEIHRKFLSRGHFALKLADCRLNSGSNNPKYTVGYPIRLQTLTGESTIVLSRPSWGAQRPSSLDRHGVGVCLSDNASVATTSDLIKTCHLDVSFLEGKN